MGWLSCAPPVFSVVAVYAYNQQFKLFAREIKNGLVSARAYMLATTLIELPFMLILALCAMLIPLYGIAAGNILGLFGTIAIMTAMLWCFDCVAQLLAVVLPHAPVGMLATLGYWIIDFLFSGGFLKPDDMLWPFYNINNITPLSYGTRSLQYLDISGTSWGGAQVIGQGFVCDQPGFCFGHTGHQVLTSLSQFFQVDPDKHFFIDIFSILLMALTSKIICFAAVIMRTRQGPSRTCERRICFTSASSTRNRKQATAPVHSIV